MFQKRQQRTNSWVTIIHDFKDEEGSNIPNNDSILKKALTAGQFLLVEWKGKRSKKNYVGQMLQIEEEGIEISCSRKHDNEGMIFIILEKEDKCWIDYDQIIQTLDNPEMHWH